MSMTHPLSLFLACLASAFLTWHHLVLGKRASSSKAQSSVSTLQPAWLCQLLDALMWPQLGPSFILWLSSSPSAMPLWMYSDHCCTSAVCFSQHFGRGCLSILRFLVGRNSSRAEAYEQHVLETDLFLLVSSCCKLEPPWLYLIGENYGACCMLTLGQVKLGKASKVFRNILFKKGRMCTTSYQLREDEGKHTQAETQTNIFMLMHQFLWKHMCKAKVIELVTDEKGYWEVGKWGGREIFNCVILSWNFWFLIQENSLSSILFKYKWDSL